MLNIYSIRPKVFIAISFTKITTGSQALGHVVQNCAQSLIEALGRVPNQSALRTNSHTAHLPRSYYTALMQSCQAQIDLLDFFKRESPTGDTEKLYYQLIGDDSPKNYDWRSTQVQSFVNSSPMWKLLSTDLSMEDMFKQIPKVFWIM